MKGTISIFETLPNCTTSCWLPVFPWEIIWYQVATTCRRDEHMNLTHCYIIFNSIIT